MSTPQEPIKATGRATPRRAQTRGQHGDVTGQQAVNLRHEHEAEIREAQQRMSTVSPMVDAGEFDEPVDYTDDARHAAAEAEEAAAQQPEVIKRGSMVIEALPRERPRRYTRSVSATGEEDPNEPVEVRFNDYYPEVTLGKDDETGEIRTFDFEAGRKYRIPRWAAEHLQSKEMLA
jgi:hypothetical protein